MDPNLFHLDYERLGEVLIAVIVLAFFVERALALVFEHRLFANNYGGKGFKEPIAFLVALAICRRWNFDAVSMTILTEQTSLFGHVITAGLIAGGSKASVSLFHDVFHSMSDAEKVRKQFTGLNDRRVKEPTPGGNPAAVPAIAGGNK
jgi:hypothetical protein